MSPIKKLKLYFSFPKLKTVQLSNGKYVGLFKRIPFGKWRGASTFNYFEDPDSIQKYCQWGTEECAMQAAMIHAFPKPPKPTLEDEIKKAMR